MQPRDETGAIDLAAAGRSMTEPDDISGTLREAKSECPDAWCDRPAARTPPPGRGSHPSGWQGVRPGRAGPAAVEIN